jgi:hypothetical protein
MKNTTRFHKVDWPEPFDKIASGVQSVAVTVAVLVGGAWTLYSFVTTKTAEKSLYDLQIAEKKLQS